ncbi:MAG: hypothetical protein JW951_08740 [Lentisphaerae bacterium]|nr:hypothetical protein [Lentisphaerota bacterium]
MMQIEIIGAESLGVRSMCCYVQTSTRRVLIDPGVALGYRRAGLLPHPVQVAAGEAVRAAILRRLAEATDVVFSHFHGDHMPLADANPYQLPLDRARDLLRTPRLWIKSVSGETPHVGARRGLLLETVGRPAPPCDGQDCGDLAFSGPMPHGPAHRPMGTVMMTCIRDGADVFVHASDIQLLADAPVEQIMRWEPAVLMASGPALYREVPPPELERVRGRALRLARQARRACVIDHHVLRCREGADWLDALRAESGGTIMCAADFMGRQRRFLESERAALYARRPVPDDWHARYAQGAADAAAFCRDA